MKQKPTPRKQWFLDRIGKRVYRNSDCSCPACENNYKNGLIIFDEMHADYLWSMEAAYKSDGDPLQYFDTVKERDEFEQGLKDQP